MTVLEAQAVPTEPVIANEKLVSIYHRMVEKNGPIRFFALLLCNGGFDNWDFVVAAPWLDRLPETTGIKEIASVAEEYLENEDYLKLSGFVVLKSGDPVLETLSRPFKTKGPAFLSVNNCNIGGLHVERALIIYSNQSNDVQTAPPKTKPRSKPAPTTKATRKAERAKRKQERPKPKNV